MQPQDAHAASERVGELGHEQDIGGARQDEPSGGPAAVDGSLERSEDSSACRVGTAGKVVPTEIRVSGTTVQGCHSRTPARTATIGSSPTKPHRVPPRVNRHAELFECLHGRILQFRMFVPTAYPTTIHDRRAAVVNLKQR